MCNQGFSFVGRWTEGDADEAEGVQCHVQVKPRKHRQIHSHRGRSMYDKALHIIHARCREDLSLLFITIIMIIIIVVSIIIISIVFISIRSIPSSSSSASLSVGHYGNRLTSFRSVT